MQETKYILSEREMPRKWYNIQADLSRPVPQYRHPVTKEPIKADDMLGIFAPGLIEQEMSQAQFIDIPEEILDVYCLWRPTPLVRARRLERALQTPAKIYYKHEGVSPAGSHKPNTAIAQAHYNKIAGKKRVATETGAGQWGCALALAGRFVGLDVTVYMVRVSYDQKPYRRLMMETWGATCYASPSDKTEYGRKILREHPNTIGSLGLAISEAVEDAVMHDDTNYCLGSVLNHVCLHQTIVGEEVQLQFNKLGQYPDVVIGCAGGGSNFAGIAFPYVRDKINGKKVDILAVEPAACPTLTKGSYTFDYGDMAQTTPIMQMYTLGHTFEPPGIHAGGLRYHGMSPLVSLVKNEGLIEARSYYQNPVFEAAVLFANTEAVIPAPETAHAVRAAIDEAIKAREEGKEKVILFNFSGNGYLDLTSYDKYYSNKLENYEYPDDLITEALHDLPKVS
ncbi:MAG TPA: TrpB-like pyridoxal phosphate-dependent enzyme [Thermodesulfobacteriota bacterium]|nr:TrpB-like pyridoxal phosphate-dependent enzyme [Thermodesulfobacteriota bacterium]